MSTLNIEKAIKFQRLLNVELIRELNKLVYEYDKFSRSLDKIDIKILKNQTKTFANDKIDLERLIETSVNLPTPDINLLSLVSNTFYKVQEFPGYYIVSISIQGIREYIEELINKTIYSHKFNNKNINLDKDELYFAKEILRRYLVKKFFKQINDKGKISVEFEIDEILCLLDIYDKNTSYDKFSNLKKFKIDKLIPKIQKLLDLEIEVYTINLGRNTERIYLECVDKIIPKTYARQLNEKYNMGIGNLEKIIKHLQSMLDGKENVNFKVISEEEYLINIGGIDFNIAVNKIVNINLDVNVKCSIKNKNYEFLIDNKIFNIPNIYTINGEKYFEYSLLLLVHFMDEINELSSGTIVGKDMSINLNDKLDKIKKLVQLGPLLNNNGDVYPYEKVIMTNEVKEVTDNAGNTLLKVKVDLDPLLKVNITKMLGNLPQNCDEYLTEYNIEDYDSMLEKGVPCISSLILTCNPDKEESYIQIPSIRFIDFYEKDIKAEIPWNSNTVLEEDEITSINNTEREYLTMNIERFIHNNISAMCKNGEILKYISKDFANKLNIYHKNNDFIDCDYEDEKIIDYRNLIF